MVKPKEYKINENITEKELSCHFFNRYDCYTYKKELYPGYIYLYLSIDKEDMYMNIQVSDNNGNIYVPFYNPDQRYNNLVYIEVVKNYNKYMDKLVKDGILEEDKERKRIKMSNEKMIEIVYHSDIEKITRIENGDWIDLRVAEDMFIPEKSFKLISLGVSMKLPKGYEAHIVPRSSTFKNFGIIQTNHCGIIDNSYSGTNDIWKFPAYCIDGKNIVNGTKGTLLHKNDRICQFRIIKKQEQVVFSEVNKLNDTDRGGFGSTGRK